MLNVLAKTAPRFVFVDYLLVILFFKRLLNNLFTISDPTSVSIKPGYPLKKFRMFSDELVRD